MVKKRVCKFWLFGVLLMLVSAMSIHAQDTIKLVEMEPLSGPFKDIGERYHDGMKYAVDEINQSGGLLGKKIELVAIDNEGKPDVATRKAMNLILKDDVKFFGVGANSSVAAALSQLAEKQNVIVFAYGPEAASMTGENCNKNFFRAGSLNSDNHSYALALKMAEKGYKRIGIIAQDFSMGKESVVAFKKKIAEVSPSTEIVAEIYHPLGNKDFAPYVSQMISARPDAIFTSNWGTDLTLLFKQGRPLGLKQNIYGYYINDEVLIESLGDDNFVVDSVGAEIYVVSIPTSKNKEFVAKFHRDKGFYPTWLRGKAYIATKFWAEAVKKAGTTDVDAVIKAWEGLSYDGPAGVWTMRACDHQVQSPIWTFEIKKDNPYFKHAYVGPAEMIPAEKVEIPCEETKCKMKK